MFRSAIFGMKPHVAYGIASSARRGQSTKFEERLPNDRLIDIFQRDFNMFRVDFRPKDLG